MPKKRTHLVNKPISFIELTRRVLLDVGAFWKILLGVIAVYAVINFIFVASFALLPSSDAIQAEIEAYLGSSAGRFIDSMVIVGVSVLNFSSPSNTVMQMVLFVLASMAFVWTLRKLRGLQKISIRQAYYEGPANSVPMLLVVIMLLITLVPSAIASSILSVAIPIIGSTFERVVVYAIAVGLILLSIWLLTVWWPAFYIAMLPEARPVASLKAAGKLTKGRRIRLLLKSIIILIGLIGVFLIVVIPVSLLFQRLVPITVYITMFILFGLGHMYMFNLYRSLVDDSESSTARKTA